LGDPNSHKSSSTAIPLFIHSHSHNYSIVNVLSYQPTYDKFFHFAIVFEYVDANIRRQSIKKPNLSNSNPASALSTLVMMALCSGDFKLYSDTSSITPRQIAIELHSLN